MLGAGGTSRFPQNRESYLAKDDDVKRVIAGSTTARACLNVGVARRVEARRARPAFAAATTRTGARFAALIPVVPRVCRLREDRMSCHSATDVEDVCPVVRESRPGDVARLRRNPAVRPTERPSHRRTA